MMVNPLGEEALSPVVSNFRVDVVQVNIDVREKIWPDIYKKAVNVIHENLGQVTNQ